MFAPAYADPPTPHLIPSTGANDCQPPLMQPLSTSTASANVDMAPVPPHLLAPAYSTPLVPNVSPSFQMQAYYSKHKPGILKQPHHFKCEVVQAIDEPADRPVM